MSPKRKKLTQIVCIILAVVMLLGLVSTALIVMANAKSSSEIKSELEALREQQSSLSDESAALKSQIEANRSQTQTIVEKKTEIDQQMELTNSSIENLNEQIQQYNLLIAEKQDELDESLQEQDNLNAEYKLRLRTMEETGKISYWSILFGAKSFSDLLDKVDMINEIAKSDQLMMAKLQNISEEITSERTELEDQMTQLEATKEELAAQQTELEAQKAENEELLLQMADAYDEMSEEYEANLAKEDELSSQIASSETAYFNALSAEEAAALKEKNKKNDTAATTSTGAASSTGWAYPLPYTCSITDAYGYRIHPTLGTYRWHNGVDFAASAGTSILATRSGTVTTAAYSEAYGYYVVINHGDGYSSMYGHMPGLIVSAGDYVTQGQTIGYVGSTGWSTGPHLHFTIYYNGADVNPLNYVG